MINLVINRDLREKERIIYAFYYLVENYSVEVGVSYAPKKNALNIYYGVVMETETGVFIPISQTDRSSNFALRNYKNIDYLSFEKDVDVPYTMTNESVTFNYDILQSSFYLLSCCEEYNIDKRDGLGRFLAKYSLRNELIQSPLFDNNSAILLEVLLKLNAEIQIKRPNFEIYLTHDVDNADSRNKYVFLHNLKDLLTNRNITFAQRAEKLITQSVSNKFKNITKYMELEKSYGAKSEFYFIQGKKHRYGSRYKLNKVKEELNAIKNSKEFIIGIHTNFFSYDDENKILAEKKLIEDYANVKISSCRNHYLRFTVPDSWEKLHNAGISFDTTLGYSDVNGFRAATSKSFVPYNIITDNVVDLYEVPLVIMDVTVMDTDRTIESKWEEIRCLLERVKYNNGTISIVWHEDVLSDKEYSEMYRRILSYVKSNEGKFVTHKDLEQRFQMQKSELKRLFTIVDNSNTEDRNA